MAEARRGASLAKAAPPGAPATADALLRHLEWTVLKRLDGLLQGDHRTLMRGAGVDLADLREYQFHDDVRHIDWNVTARLQVPYVRQFIEDRDLTAWFLLDCSGSIDFGSSEVTKLALASAFVATLARVITRHGNRVGAVFYGAAAGAPGGGQQVLGVLPPGATRSHVLQLLARMRAAGEATPRGHRAARPAKRRRGEAEPPAAAGTDLAALLHFAGGIVKRRCVLFVVSDFISAPGWAAAMGRLAQRHEVIAVRVWDPLEMALPDLGLVTVEDAETGEQLFIDASDPAFRERFERFAAEQEAALVAALASSGADTLELATDDDLLDTLLRFSDLRRRRARAAPGTRLPAHLKPTRTAAPEALA
jgi:uncharacterized protein (DUF58 family)